MHGQPVVSSVVSSAVVGQAVLSDEPSFVEAAAGEPDDVHMQPVEDASSEAELVTSQALIPHLFPTSRVDQPIGLASVVESCLRLLSAAPWPSSQRARPAVANLEHQHSGYWNFGVRLSDKSSLTAVTISLRSVVRCASVGLGARGTLYVLATIVFPLHTKIWRMRKGLGFFLLSLGSFQQGELWLEDPAGDVPLFVPKLGRSLTGRLVDAHAKPFDFDPKLWHGSTQWQGDRWVLIAYSLPDVPHDALVDLHFPLQGLVPSNPGDELSCPADAIQPAVQENVFLLPHHPKLFLDLCSGATSPLASEALARGIPSLPVDILLDSKHDLLQDCTFEQLLRLAFAGRFAFAHASPPCTEYSRLKLRPGPGPPPCRSPDHLRGLPSNDAAAALRVVRSRTILERCVQILLAVCQCGGHCDLEQPRNAMSWLEPQFKVICWMLRPTWW